jgi:hypothetical protein
MLAGEASPLQTQLCRLRRRCLRRRGSIDFDFREARAVRLALAAGARLGTATVTRKKTQAYGRGTRIAVLAIAASLAVTALAGTAEARGTGFIGTVDPFATRCNNLLAKGDDCLSNKDLQRMERSHLTSVRWGFRWSEVERVQGTYNWGITDRTIGALANHGMGVLPVMSGSPTWAAPSYGTAPVKTSTARKGWRKFLKAAIRRYGPGGNYWTNPGLYRSEHPDGRRKPIKTWQIWNEQNIKGGAQYVKPRKYRKLIRISDHAIRKADPKARVLLGGMPGYVRQHAWAYLKKLYEHRHFKRHFDAVALHPYSPDVSHVLIQIDRMRKVMRRHGDGHAALWITELGWGSAEPSKNAPINKGPEGQRILLRRTFPILRRYHDKWRLRHAYWFRWRDPPPNRRGCTFCASSGLFHYSEDPKPSWKAFKHVTRAR